MMKVPYPGRGAISGSLRSLGLAAAAMLVLTAATGQRAEALSLINPAAAPSAKYASDALTIEVRGGHGHGGGGFRGGGGGGFRGGGGGGFRGGGFHGGGFRGGGAAIHGGGFRGGGAVIRGGGFRAGPAFHRGGGYRFAAPGIVRHSSMSGRGVPTSIIATISARATTRRPTIRSAIFTRAGSAGWSGPITVRARSAAIARGTTTWATGCAIARRSTGEVRTAS